MKKKTEITVVVAILAGFFFLAGYVMAGAGKGTSHPELSENEMLVPCSECHMDNTPDIYQEWYDSVHGIGMVKCYQCHGTFETFKVTPSVQDCATCHTAMTAEDHSENKVCWECHAPHVFKPAK